ncbi:type VI secretion system Vgr family protein [Pseudomonas caspiana]
MAQPITDFFVHSRHKLRVSEVQATLDVLTFTGEERLSEPFKYTIEFTCTEQDLAPAQILGRKAWFSLYGPPPKFPQMSPDWLTVIPQSPLRTVYGVVTGFKRLSDSRDEARYEIVLQPRLALLDRGKQYRIYQHKSVPQIVESILLSRHGFKNYDLNLQLQREYPKREQVMQYGESDLAFITRLLAEVGIWYRFEHHNEWHFEIVEFCDHQRFYQFDIELPLLPQSGLSSNGEDAVWQLQTEHRVVEKNINFRAYNPRGAYARLDGEVDQTGGDQTTYGEAYHYGEPYTELGNALQKDERLQTESGHFYARLRHEQYLNSQTQLSGVSSSATLAPAQVLTIKGGAPLAFKPRIVLTSVKMTAARGRSLEVEFEAMPYSETVCFRPKVPAKPQIAGTIPARVTSPDKNPRYAEVDQEGRYRVNFLFDRDEWMVGRESMWLRLARPYAGDTHGLHLPLIPGTEVAIAFEHGDPDRPYIAHALHDDRHPDHITDRRRDHTRNVLRTSANNKLRMEDLRGSEHIKLSTEHSGKSQLNLGHLVDAKKEKRGEGFELRTDGHGALRAGAGLFISADEQPKAQGQVLDMNAAVAQLQKAGEQLQNLSADAQAAKGDPADVQAQLNLLKQDLEQLKTSVLLLSAPQGIALTSGQHLQLAAQKNLMFNAGAEADISVVKRLFIGVGEGLSLFVRKLGIKLIANQGSVSIQAQNDALELMARHSLQITSTEDEIHITAKKKIVINGGGSYITLDPNSIESGTAGDFNIKAASYLYDGPASMTATHPEYPKSLPSGLTKQSLRLNLTQAANAPDKGWARMPYTLYADGAPLQKGILDKTGQLLIEHQVVTRQYRLELANGVTYQIPIPTEYDNAEQGVLANSGLHNHRSQPDDGLSQPVSHTDHRDLYAAVLQGLNDDQEDNPQ